MVNKSLLALSSILFFLISCTAHKPTTEKNESRAYTTRHIVILVIDGPRYSETWGDPSHKYIPQMSKNLAPEGIINESFYNTGFTYTNAGHTAITTGLHQNISNGSKKEHPKRPSFFQYFLKESGLPREKAWLITSKDKLEALANTKDKDWENKFLPSHDCGISGHKTGYRDDAVTLDSVIIHLKEHHPVLTLINFKEPDASGHANNWEGYLQGIKDTDEYAYRIWQFLQNDSVYKNSTTFIVTNDHGRHNDGWKDGFVSHGDNCDGCRHINFFAAGPDFKKGVIISEKYDQRDIPVTVAELLHFSMPTADGKVMWELFKE